jgi:hypothetical protein
MGFRGQAYGKSQPKGPKGFVTVGSSHGFPRGLNMRWPRQAVSNGAIQVNSAGS